MSYVKSWDCDEQSGILGGGWSQVISCWFSSKEWDVLVKSQPRLLPNDTQKIQFSPFLGSFLLFSWKSESLIFPSLSIPTLENLNILRTLEGPSWFLWHPGKVPLKKNAAKKTSPFSTFRPRVPQIFKQFRCFKHFNFKHLVPLQWRIPSECGEGAFGEFGEWKKNRGDFFGGVPLKAPKGFPWDWCIVYFHIYTKIYNRFKVHVLKY